MGKEVRQKIFDHIKENAKKKDIHILQINGYLEHVHCIISLNSDQDICTVMNLIKGESSHWVNKNKLIQTKFGWQDDYYAASVGEYHLPRLIRYIKNQDSHHQKQSFQKEYDKMVERFGLEKQKG